MNVSIHLTFLLNWRQGNTLEFILYDDFFFANKRELIPISRFGEQIKIYQRYCYLFFKPDIQGNKVFYDCGECFGGAYIPIVVFLDIIDHATADKNACK